MASFEDLTGRVFGRWTVLSLYKKPRVAQSGKQQFTKWLCRCACGTEKIVQGSNMVRGVSKSCGCLRRELITTHGLSYDPLYHTWANIKARCLDTTHIYYGRYGGRGINVHSEWVENFQLFKQYVDTNLGACPSSRHTIDRINNDQGYEPGNMRWATDIEQMSNRTNTFTVMFDGELVPLSVLCREKGVPLRLVYNRVRYGWDVVAAIHTPKGARNPALSKNTEGEA